MEGIEKLASGDSLDVVIGKINRNMAALMSSSPSRRWVRFSTSDNPDVRIDLSKLCDIEANGDLEIKFYYEHGSTQKIGFDTKNERNAAFSKLDEMLDTTDIVISKVHVEAEAKKASEKTNFEGVEIQPINNIQ